MVDSLESQSASRRITTTTNVGWQRLNIDELIGAHNLFFQIHQTLDAMANRQIYNPEHSPLNLAVRVNTIANVELVVVLI